MLNFSASKLTSVRYVVPSVFLPSVAILLNNELHILGINPRSLGSHVSSIPVLSELDSSLFDIELEPISPVPPSLPIIVYVFPEPVCPYAKTQTLYPLKALSTTPVPKSLKAKKLG